MSNSLTTLSKLFKETYRDDLGKLIWPIKLTDYYINETRATKVIYSNFNYILTENKKSDKTLITYIH